MTKMILIFTFHVKNRNIENVIDFCILCVRRNMLKILKTFFLHVTDFYIFM